LWAWGGNSLGEIGDGSYTSKSLPVVIAYNPTLSNIGGA
jgi:hypothetical protein